MKAQIITAGSVCGAIVAMFMAYHQLMPEPAKIVTNERMEARIVPVEQEVEVVEQRVQLNAGNMNYLKGNFATRNISWLHEKLCFAQRCGRMDPGCLKPSVRRMYFDDLEAEYRVYEAATGRKHRYELIGFSNVCETEY